MREGNIEREGKTVCIFVCVCERERERRKREREKREIRYEKTEE
jgi:hypothetical protein